MKPTRFRFGDIGILPLMVSLPLMYFPTVLSGDTQPWVLLGALIALFTFRTATFLQKKDISLIILSFFSVFVYALRGRFDYLFLRFVYIHVAFVVLWIVAQRERGLFFGYVIRITIVIWFLFGFYEFVSMSLGHGLGVPPFLAGRFGSGQRGVPSLTAEPSFYGSMSMLQIMYLLSEGKRENKLYIACAAASVILSGSLLSLALFFFPFMKLPMRFRIAALLSLPLLVVLVGLLGAEGLSARLSQLNVHGSFADLLSDPSLNLRIGHLYFTLVHHFWSSIFLTSHVNFMADYNDFAANSGLFIPTGSDFCLSSAGEMVYSSGIVGLSLIFAFLSRVQKQTVPRSQRFAKVLFIAACMLNPITLANPFLIFYAAQRN